MLSGPRSRARIVRERSLLDVDCCLLAFAAHVVIPIHKGALRVVTPSPDVQLEEGVGYAKPVGSANELEGLAFEHRWHTLVVRQPGGSVDDELNTHETEPVPDWFVNQRLRVSGVISATLGVSTNANQQSISIQAPGTELQSVAISMNRSGPQVSAK